MGTLLPSSRLGGTQSTLATCFFVANESSRHKFLGTGQQVAVSGETIGIYLFRNSDYESGGRFDNRAGGSIPPGRRQAAVTTIPLTVTAS